MRAMGLWIFAISMLSFPAHAQDYKQPEKRIFAPAIIAGGMNEACEIMRAALEESYYDTADLPSPIPADAQVLTPQPVPLTLVGYDGVTPIEYGAFYTLNTQTYSYVLHHWQPWLAGSPTYQYAIADQSVGELLSLAETYPTIAEFREQVEAAYLRGHGRFYDEYGDAIFFELAGEVYVHRTAHYSGAVRDPLVVTRLTDGLPEASCTLQTYPDNEDWRDVSELPQLPPLTIALYEKVMVPYGAPFGYECGRSASRLDVDLRGSVFNLLKQIEERPWVFHSNLSALYNLPTSTQENHSFQQYAYQGIWEWRAYVAIRDFQYLPTMRELANYIADRHGFDLPDAETMAAGAIMSLVKLIPPFPGTRRDYYGPADYRALRDRYAASENLRPNELDFLLRMMILAPQEDDNLRGVIGRFKHISDQAGPPLYGPPFQVGPPLYGPPFSIDILLYESVLNVDAVLALLEEGASVDAANGFGKTALMHAAHHNAFEVAKLLLDRGANAQLETGPNDDHYFCPQLTVTRRTALTYALENADADLIHLILDFNTTDPSIGSATGEPMLDHQLERKYLGLNQRLTVAEKNDIQIRLTERNE